MATAMARGFVQSGRIGPDRILAIDPDPQACQRFADSLPGCKASAPAQGLPEDCRVVVLAVKPHFVDSALAGFVVPPRSCIVSVVAGLTLKSLESRSGHGRIVRAMPNTPALIGEAATGYCCSPKATEEDRQLVRLLLESIGLAIEVDEPLLDTVTGLSGSGPAFVFRFIESLIDAGVLNGLSRAQSRRLAVQTVFGSARMMLESGDHPRLLADRVTSPMGTTASGLRELDDRGFASAILAAVSSATNRARELGR